MFLIFRVDNALFPKGGKAKAGGDSLDSEKGKGGKCKTKKVKTGGRYK